MFASIGLTISGFVFLSLIAFFYFIKKRYYNLENDIFRVLIIVTLILLLLEIICVYTMSTRHLYPLLNDIFCRGYIFGVIIWISIILIYLWALGRNIKYENVLDIFKEKIVIFCIIFGILSFAISCFLDLTYTSGEHETLYVIAGPGVYVLYVFFIILNGYMLYVLIKNKSSNSLFKRLPIFMFLLLFSTITIAQLIYEDINDLTYLFTFCVIAMYFTLENPDIKLVQELEEANKKAIEANNEKNNFLSRMSHEIRTPLNSIMGFSEAIILNKSLTKETLIEDSKNINIASINLLEIINNILDITRIESGNEKIENNEYSLKDILYELTSYAQAKLEDKDVNFVINADKNIPKTLIGDKYKIHSILQGIINNAIKFTKSGQIKLTVTSTIKKDKCLLNFIISDTGIGIKEENYDKLFLKFARLSLDSEIDNLNSTGLGLAIVKDLVELLGGNITFSSTYGVGTTFNISLENGYSGTDILGEFELDKNDYINNEDYSLYNVLLVDDNTINLSIISSILKLYKFNITKCKNGLEAVNRIKKNEKYDIIFVDSVMPEMDGIETINVITKLRNNYIPKIRIAISNNYAKEEENICLKEGFTDYLAKPIDKKSVRKILVKHDNIFKEGEK